MRRALISVSNKDGVVDLARGLREREFTIVSTGGTAALLREHGVEVTDVAAVTGFPEIMDGRVKTLHPTIHGGLLGRRGVDEAVMAEHGIERDRPGRRQPVSVRRDGRAAGLHLRGRDREHRHRRPGHGACRGQEPRPRDRDRRPARLRAVLAELRRGQRRHQPRIAQAPGGEGLRAHRAVRRRGRELPRAPARRLAGAASDFPDLLGLQFRKRLDLRYGENPHQQAAFYVATDAQGAGIGSASQLQGKELSYNNLADADTAFECVRQFDEPACVIVKHANPCGVARRHDAARRLRQRLPHRPDLGLRRHHRLQSPARRRDRSGDRRAASSSR